MSSKKYYAIKRGRKTGIFNSWNECKSNIEGYSNAIYKSFTSYEDAKKFLYNDNTSLSNTETSDVMQNEEQLRTIEAYVDGSYNEKLRKYSYGCVLLGETTAKLSGIGSDIKNITMRNVAGEILGAMKAIEWAVQNKYEKVIVYHDYEGIARWALGEWKANLIGTKNYVDFIKNYRKLIRIEFRKVVAHSGNYYNEQADSLARQAFQGGGNLSKPDNSEDITLKIFSKIMSAKEKTKNSFTIKFSSYSISENKLKKFAKELWALQGHKIDEIDVINMCVDPIDTKIEWSIKDSVGNTHNFNFKI